MLHILRSLVAFDSIHAVLKYLMQSWTPFTAPNTPPPVESNYAKTNNASIANDWVFIGGTIIAQNRHLIEDY